MKPRISFITLGVDNLERALCFYRDGLGLPTQGIIGSEFEHGAVVFFKLQSGLTLALWPRSSIAHETGLPVATPAPSNFMLAHNLNTPAEVDSLLAQARHAGATILKEPHTTFYGGYAAYFLDPDQHLWEIVWNPHLSLE